MITVFVHIPTLRIRPGCQCPRRTRSWPSSRELTGTGSTSFFFAPRQCTVLYPLPHSFSNDVWQGETEQIWAKVSKYVHNDIGYPRSEQCHFGPVAQDSLVLGSKIKERIYIGQCYTVTKNKLRWEIFEKYINNPIEIQSEVLSQCESCIIYNLSLMIFVLLSFQIASSLSPILKVFTSSSLLLFGRSFSFNIRFKITPSGLKLNKYYNYNETDSSIMFKLLLYSFG